MNRQSGLFVRTELKPEDAFGGEHLPCDKELVRLIRIIVDSLNSEIGILSRHSLDEMTPAVLASVGMPDPNFALAAIDDALTQRHTNIFNGLNGHNTIQDNDFTDLTISQDKDNKTYNILQAVVACDTENLFILSIGRDAEIGAFSPDERRTGQGLISIFFQYFKELQNSFKTSNPMDCLVCALELWDIGIIIIDHRSRIVFSNSAANTILDTGNGLKRIGHNLSANRLDDTARLQSAILFSIQASLEDRMKINLPKVPVVAIERDQNRRPLFVSVAPIPPIASTSGQSAAVLYIVDPDRDMHDSINAICQTYGLTNVEAELASNLVMGLTMVQAAKKMHIQVNTARSYLKQVFQKTMTNRQADLVRVILASSFNPVKNLHLSPL